MKKGESNMTNNQFKRVGIHDSKWVIEAVQFDQNEENLTKAYPRWFIMLLVGQDPRGFNIAYHAPTSMWFLRNPWGPDYVLNEDSWVCRNNEGICFVNDTYTMESKYRLWEDEFDGKDV